MPHEIDVRYVFFDNFLQFLQFLYKKMLKNVRVKSPLKLPIKIKTVKKMSKKY